MNRNESQAVNRLIISHGKKVKLLEEKIGILKAIAFISMLTGLSIGATVTILFYSDFI